MKNKFQVGDLVEYRLTTEDRMYDKEKRYAVVLNIYSLNQNPYVELLWDDGEVNNRHTSAIKLYE